MVNVTDNLCIKQGNSKIKPAAYNQEQVIMTSIRYADTGLQWLIVMSTQRTPDKFGQNATL